MDITRCVLFDLDGTLIDTWELYNRATDRMLQANGRSDFTEEEVSTLRLNTETRLLGYFFPPEEVKRAHERFLSYYRKLHARYFEGVYPGVVNLLQSLRNRSIRTGIVTGKSRSAWEITRQFVGLGDFDTTVCDDDVNTPKPDCEGLVKAMANLRVAPSETIYVGDSVNDLEAAISGGVRFLAALWPKTRSEIMKFKRAAADIGPYAGLGHPDDLKRFL